MSMYYNRPHKVYHEEKKETGEIYCFSFFARKAAVWKKICFFLLLKGNDAIAWLLFALEGKKKNSDAEEW